MKNPDAAHFARIEQHAGSIYQMYLKALRDITRLMHSVPIDTSIPFNFNDYPEIKHRVNNYIQSLSKSVKLQIENGISSEWLQANVKNDEKLNQILKGSRLSEAQKKVYYSRNQAGLKAFLQRKEDGLNLSDRVWLYTNQYKNEIEMAVDIAISEKVSAQNLSQTVRQYLQQPDTLFRRVRDKNGVLHLSKKAANYHPGRGVYRSAYKNAMRLARTEINMAYRTADHDRMNDLPFVKGFKVVTSNNHPVRDICDDLKGDYPKEFKFVGWHTHCRCHVITIMVSDKEYNEIEDRLLAGEEISGYKSPNAINDVPAGFKNWIDENKDRAKGWKSQPYFIRDNFEGGKLTGSMKIQPGTLLVPKKRIKTDAEKIAIQNKWAERKQQNELILSIGKSVLQDAKSFPEINVIPLQDLINLKKVKEIEAQSKLLQQQITEISAEETRLSTLLDNVKALKAQHGLTATQDLYKAVESKLSSWENLPLEHQKKKLEFEIGWVEKNQKYSTWKAAQDAYKKRLSAVEYQVEKDNIKTLSETAFNFAKTNKNKAIKDLAAGLKEMFDKNAPISQLQYGANKLNTKVNELIAKQAKKASKSIKSGGSFIYDKEAYTKARKDAALWAKDPYVADNAFRPHTTSLWKTASHTEKKAGFEYTRGSGGFNRPLRGFEGSWYDFKGVGKVSLNYEKQEDLIHGLTDLINRSEFPYDVWVQRGASIKNWRGVIGKDFTSMSKAELQQLKGTEGLETAFSSCGAAKGKGFTEDVILNIYCPKGTKMVYAQPFSYYGDMASGGIWDGKFSTGSLSYEQEMIIQRNTTYRITKIEYTGNRYYFDVEVVSQ